MSSQPKSPGRILVIGAGGHAKAVVGAAKVTGYDVRAIYDDDEPNGGKASSECPSSDPSIAFSTPRIPVIVAIADAATRKAFVDRLPLEWGTLIHSTAIIDPTVEIGPGTVAFAGVVVQADARIGGARHPQRECHRVARLRPGRVCASAPGVDLASGVHIGIGSFLGIGAVATSGIRVGCWTTVGAGAAVTCDLPDRVVAVGCPARVIKTVEIETFAIRRGISVTATTRRSTRGTLRRSTRSAREPPARGRHGRGTRNARLTHDSERIMALIWDAIGEVNELLPDDARVPHEDNAVLLGQGGRSTRLAW